MSNIQISNKNDLELIEDEIIRIYQTTDTGEKVVDGRELHKYLNVGTRFNDWIDRKIGKFGFEESLDFSEFLSESNGGRPSKEYVFKINPVKIICRKSKRPKSASALKFLNKANKNGKEVYIRQSEREEVIFKNELENVLEEITPLKHQYQVLSYRLDFYLPEYNLAIEFDERHHKYQKQNDLKREKEIKKELNCKFVRIKSEEKLSIGLNKILKEVL